MEVCKGRGERKLGKSLPICFDLFVSKELREGEQKAAGKVEIFHKNGSTGICVHGHRSAEDRSLVAHTIGINGTKEVWWHSFEWAGLSWP